jgi:hypothetical protein
MRAVRERHLDIVPEGGSGSGGTGETPSTLSLISGKGVHPFSIAAGMASEYRVQTSAISQMRGAGYFPLRIKRPKTQTVSRPSGTTRMRRETAGEVASR